MPARPGQRHLLVPAARLAWWRPQPAEDFEPPACHVCTGLTRLICRNCERYFCKEHAGSHGLCAECAWSARLGTLILVILFGGIAALIVAGWLGLL